MKRALLRWMNGSKMIIHIMISLSKVENFRTLLVWLTLNQDLFKALRWNYFFFFTMTSSRLALMRARLNASQTESASGKSLNFDRLGGYEDVVLARPLKFGLELVHICSPSKLCMGKVGNTKVCLETLSPGSTRCSRASHATKVAFSDNVNSFLLVKANEKAVF